MAVVAITGASAGIGRACARLFAERGYDVGLIARGPDGLAGAVADVERAGSRAVAVPVDVSDAEAVEKASRSISEELGPIDIWVNNAMATVYGPFLDISADEYKRVTEVTYLGFVNGTRAALHRMMPRDRGVIVQVGSSLAYRGIPLQSAYCGAKHAVQGFTDSVRCELIHDRSGVRLVEVQLPAVNTPQFRIQRSKLRRKTRPVPPIYQPELAAEAIWHAAHHRRRQIWVGFPTVYTILGDRLASPLLDSFLGRTGFESQQLDEPRPADDPDNLYDPVSGDHGAHGSFDAKALASSRQLRLTLSRPVARLAEGIDDACAAAGRGLARLTERKQPRRTPSPDDTPLPG